MKSFTAECSAVWHLQQYTCQLYTCQCSCCQVTAVASATVSQTSCCTDLKYILLLNWALLVLYCTTLTTCMQLCCRVFLTTIQFIIVQHSIILLYKTCHCIDCHGKNGKIFSSLLMVFTNLITDHWSGNLQELHKH